LWLRSSASRPIPAPLDTPNGASDNNSNMLLDSTTAARPRRTDPEALFEEAREHRRLRWLRLSAIGALAAIAIVGAYALFGGGTSHGTGPARIGVPVVPHSTKFTQVRIYFNVDASRGQEQAVARKLAADPVVRRVRFVSKASAFAALKKTTPKLVAGLAYNPLPDTFRVTVGDRKYAAALRKKLTPLPSGVNDVVIGR
jgi:hypothetical protein